MDVSMVHDTPWRLVVGGGVALVGLALVWRGLIGRPGGERGLIRRRTTMLGRLHGWRLFLLGLTLTGVGAAWYWDARWLLILSLGFGYVEMQEATGVINAWRSNGGRTPTADGGARRAAPVGTDRRQPGGIRP